MAAYQGPPPPQTAQSGYEAWSQQAANWAAQQQAYQYPSSQPSYDPYTATQPSHNPYTATQPSHDPYTATQPSDTQYVGQPDMSMYGAGYGYNMGYNQQGYVGQPAMTGDGSQHYVGGDTSGQQYGYVGGQEHQHWGGWEQNTEANGMGSGQEGDHGSRGRGGMGRSRGGGPPAFGSGRGGGPPAFGSGRGGGPRAVGSGQGGGAPLAFDGGHGGPPSYDSGFGEQRSFGSGRGGGPPSFGSGRGGGPPSFGSGRGGGPPSFGSGRGGGKPAFGSGRGGGKPAFGSGKEGGPPAFGSGRGSGSDRGRGFGGDRGRGGGGNRGRGFGGDKSSFRENKGRGFGGDRERAPGGNRGRGFGGDRGRGSSGDRGRGRGGMGRGEGAPGRGRGGGNMSSDRGRGAGGRGGASFGTRGGGRGTVSPQESVTVADTGVGLASIGDLIKSAEQRRLRDASKGLSEDAPLSVFVERWKSFTKSFVDCGNAISNLECSLKASKLDLLQLRSETDLLSKVCSAYNIFTSTLILVKKFAPLDQRNQESTFLARGLGLNKKAAKSDCYQKAYKLLMEAPVQEIMSQVDTDENTLRQEISILYTENRKGFMDLLRKTGEIADTIQSNEAQPNGSQQTPKRKAPASSGDHSAAKKVRHLPEDYMETQSSLAPKKKQSVVMQRSAPLPVKLTRLKELLKEEGITKLHIVPKIDQFALKTAITIRNVYKFLDIPPIGYEHKTPLYCEIYFDDVWVATSEPHIKRSTAMHQAYSNFTDTLCTESVDNIAHNKKSWSVAMESMPDVFIVCTKGQGEDNDCLLTSNLANMKQMMHSMPHLKFPIHKMVLTEHETDKNIENIFKSLELSATRNLVLLECEILRNLDNTFTCNISLQGKVMASRVHSVKNVAKRLASEAVMNQLKNTNDYIYVTADYVGDTYTKDDLFKKAREKKEANVPVPPALQNILSKVLVKKLPEGLNPEAQKRFEEDAAANTALEDLPENRELRPLLPYLGLVVYEILDNYYETLSLEDIIFDVGGMARSHRETVGLCANKMGMRFNTRVRNMENSSLLRRCVTASDMSKMLQIHGGSSGRYKLSKCHNPCSQEELDTFKSEYLAVYETLKSSRYLEEEGETAPPTPQPVSPVSKVNKSPAKPVGPAKAWENNEPLDFKGPQGAGAGRGAPQGSKPSGPPGVRGPRPLMAGPVDPSSGHRPVRPPPPRHGAPPRHGGPPPRHPAPQRPPQPLMQARPQRMAPPRPRMGGHFQY